MIELALERVQLKDLFNSPLNCKYLKDIEVVIGKPEERKIFFLNPRNFTVEYERLNWTCALIGSREIDQEGINAVTFFGSKINKLGYVGLSGGAHGADQAFEKVMDHMNIFLPWENFNDKKENIYYHGEIQCGVFNPDDRYDFSIEKIAHEVEGNHYQYLTSGHKDLKKRNVHQIMGRKLNSYVDFVVCWTSDGANNFSNVKKKKGGTGGTGFAIKLADRLNIPVFNLKNKEDQFKLDKLLRFLYEQKGLDYDAS